MNGIARKILRCQREIEAARKPSMEDACAAFLVNTAVNIGGGIYTFLTEADCRQIKGAAKPASREVAPIGRPAEAAPPSVQKFKVGDRVRRVEFGADDCTRIVTGYTDAGRVKYDRFYGDDPRGFADSAEERNLELIEPAISPASETETEGWVAHVGSEFPVGEGVRVDVRFRSGEEAYGVTALKRDGVTYDIVAYRVVKP